METLAEQLAVFRAVADASYYWEEWVNLDGKLSYISPACKRITGYSPEEFLANPLLVEEIIHPDDQALFDSYLDQVATEPKKSFQMEYRIIHHNGEVRWIDLGSQPVNGRNNEFLGQRISFRDVTYRKRTEEELRESHQLIEALLDGLTEVVVVADPDGTILLANRELAQRLEMDLDELVGKNISDVLPPEIAETRRNFGNQVIQTGSPIRVQEKGKAGLYDSIYYPVMNEKGIVEKVAVLSYDITKLKMTEEELRQSRNQLEVILNGVADSVVALDTEGRMIFANQVAASRHNYPSGEALVGDKEFPKLLEFYDEEDNLIPYDKRPWYSALKGIICPPTITHYYTKDVREDRWIVIQSTPIFDESGKTQMGVVIFHDISELKHTQQELQKARQELEQRVEERTLELAQANQQLREEIEMRKQAEITIRQKAAHSEALARVAARINTKLDLKSVLQTICDETASAINYPGCAIMLFNEEIDCFEMVSNTSGLVTDRSISISREQYEGFLEAFGPVIAIPDVSTLPNAPYPELVATRQTRTIVSAPLVHDGKLVGNLNVYSFGEIHMPTEDEMSLLKGFAVQASIAIANARMFEEISESHKRLQTLSERLVKIQEEERRTIARELHDEIGQLLTSLSLNCDIILKSLEEDRADLPKITNQFDRSKQMINHLVTQVRKLSLELRPEMLDDLGLLPALLDHFERYSSQTNIKVQFKHHGLDGRYSTDVETTAFRIVQEALTNVARYAKVGIVSVHLWVDRGLLKLKVEDQGVGFDLDAVEKANTSVGISSMRERAILCGGELEIETIPGRGTCLTAELPLDIDSTRSENVHQDTARR